MTKRDLSIAEGLDEVVLTITANISQTFAREVILFLPEDQDELAIKPYTLNPNFHLDNNEVAVAAWAYKHSEPAGRGTDTLSASDGRYIPLKTANGVVGIGDETRRIR